MKNKINKTKPEIEKIDCTEHPLNMADSNYNALSQCQDKINEIIDYLSTEDKVKKEKL